MPLATYKLRAELRQDISNFLNWHKRQNNGVVIETVEIKNRSRFEPIWTFECNLEHTSLISYIYSSSVPDLHYFFQSVKPAHLFDGERDNICYKSKCRPRPFIQSMVIN